MARPVNDRLARARRRAVLVLAITLAVPLAFLTRDSNEWVAFAVGAAFVGVLVLCTSVYLLGPFVKDEGLPEDTPPDEDGPTSWFGRHRDKQLVLTPQPHQSHARADQRR